MAKRDNTYLWAMKRADWCWANIILIYILWEPKMCRLAWQLLGMLGNVLGRPRHVLQRPRHACNVLGVLGMLPARS